MKQVAEEAGVSLMTVSAVLRPRQKQNYPVADATRERVLAAARNLDYFPNAFAQGLRRQRINTLGVVLFHPDPRLKGDPNVCGLLDGIFTVANARDQNITVFNGKRWSDAAHSLPVFCDGRTDGLIILWPSTSSDVIPALLRVEVPFVVINGFNNDPRVTTVGVNNIAAMQGLAGHLLEHGHRRIAYFSGPAEGQDSHDRYEGYCRALSAAGVPCDPALFFPGAYNTASGFERARALLRNPKQIHPTAICCESDRIAQGAYQALTEAGLRVPGDISVTGFDDIPEAATMTPPLTTVHQSFETLGRRGAELLLDIVDAGTAPAVKEVIPTELILRASVAPPL